MSSLEPIPALLTDYVVTEARHWYQCRLLDGEPKAFFQEFCNEYTALLRRHEPAAKLFTLRDLAALTKQNTEIWCLLWQGRTLVGALEASLSWPRGNPRVTINDLLVAPMYRGQDLERMLWRHLLAMIAERWSLPLPLYCEASVPSGSDARVALYRNLGFLRDGNAEQLVRGQVTGS